jgi:site-specific recombinase
MLDPADEAPVQEILPVLELDHQYTRLVEAWNHELVTQIRRCGREAGKRLGYKIRTLTSDPEQRVDGRVAVWVVVIRSNPDDKDRIRERGELLISETLNQLLG